MCRTCQAFFCLCVWNIFSTFWDVVFGLGVHTFWKKSVLLLLYKNHIWKATNKKIPYCKFGVDFYIFEHFFVQIRLWHDDQFIAFQLLLLFGSSLRVFVFDNWSGLSVSLSIARPIEVRWLFLKDQYFKNEGGKDIELFKKNLQMREEGSCAIGRSGHKFTECPYSNFCPFWMDSWIV